MSQPEVDVVDWNKNAHFPVLPDGAIERPHQLHAIEDALSTEVPVIFLEGEPLDGATCTLAQFCEHKPTQTFSLFITPASKLTYSVDYLRLLLAEQFAMCLGVPSFTGDSVAKSEYDNRMHWQRSRVRRCSSNAFRLLAGLWSQCPSRPSLTMTP